VTGLRLYPVVELVYDASSWGRLFEGIEFGENRPRVFLGGHRLVSRGREASLRSFWTGGRMEVKILQSDG
jgi:hypothetical protein